MWYVCYLLVFSTEERSRHQTPCMQEAGIAHRVPGLHQVDETCTTAQMEEGDGVFYNYVRMHCLGLVILVHQFLLHHQVSTFPCHKCSLCWNASWLPGDGKCHMCTSLIALQNNNKWDLENSTSNQFNWLQEQAMLTCNTKEKQVSCRPP